MKKTTLFSLALAAGLALSPSLAGAQTKVTLTTAKTAGAAFSFTTNPGTVTVDWGDGKPVSITSTGEPIQGDLKGQTITVSADNLWFLDCSSNELTAINVADGSSLSTFFCSDNKLTTLDLNSMRNLVNLDCSGNEVSYLGLTLMKSLETLNCANNQLTSLSLSGPSNLKTLICSGNKLSSLTLSTVSALETLWCQDNTLKTLNLSSNRNLKSVVCDDNEISTLNMSNCTGLVDFWCDNNKLTSLSMQNNANLQTLSCSNNELTTLTIPAANSSNKSLAFYCDGNNLTFASMHSLDNMVNSANMLYSPQGTFALPKTQIKVNEQFTLDGLDTDADGNATSPSYVWKNGEEELVKGSNADYTARSNMFTFKKPFQAIHCEVTSPEFPGLVLSSENLAVSDGTGIQDIMDAYGFSYVTNNGTITMKSGKPYRVSIYTVDGKQVWTGIVTNEEQVSLGHGIFLVNGVKISL
jgi:hypothetical protein